MTCDHIRELISASVDGEGDAADMNAIEKHVKTCQPCRAFHDEAWTLRRDLRVRSVAATRAPIDRPGRDLNIIGPLRAVSALRVLLFVIGGTLLILNAQAILSSSSSTAAHVSRHDGVFGTALGFGMLAVAAKPHRAIGLVPLTSALAVLMAIVGTADLASGNATIVAEAIHVVEFGGLVCLWVISGGPARLQRRGQALGHRVAARRASTVPQWPTA